MNGAKAFLLLTMTLILVMGGLAAMAWFHQQREVLYLGLAGPMSGRFDAVGLSMQRGVELAIREANEQSKPGAHELKLVVADDRSNLSVTEHAVKAAEKLAAQDHLIGVVGHYFSRPTLAAQKVYETHHIPLITPSATHPSVTAGSPWTFSLIQDDYYQAVFLANYVIHGLAREKIAVVHARDTYGRTQAEYFLNELVINEISPLVKVEVDQDRFDGEKLNAHLREFQEAQIILLAMNYTTAAQVIKFLRDKNVETDFIGGESLGGPHFIREAGIYSENVYAVSPYLPNLYGEESRQFEEHFVRAYQVSPDWIATYSYESARMLLLALAQEGPDTERIRNFLRKITREEDAVESIAGPIHFNEDGASRRPIAIGQVKNGRYVPARFQLTQVKYPELAKARSVPVIQMDGRFLKRTTVVFTGVYVNEIKSFDPIHANFVADFLLWFRWDPDQNAKLDFEMTYGRVISASIREKYFDKKTQDNFISYAVTAELQGDFPLHDYPLDRQILKIRIKPKTKTREDLILVTDIPDDSFLRKHLDFGSWRDVKHLQFTSQKDGIWSYRNPKYNKKLFELDNSQYNYLIHLERQVSQYVVKLLPLLVVVATAYLLFFISLEYVPSRFAIGTTTLLSAMAFHGVNKIEVGYLVRIDVFFMMTYYLIFFTLVETAVAAILRERGRLPMANRLDTISATIFPVLLLGAMAILFGK